PRAADGPDADGGGGAGAGGLAVEDEPGRCVLDARAGDALPAGAGVPRQGGGGAVAVDLGAARELPAVVPAGGGADGEVGGRPGEAGAAGRGAAAPAEELRALEADGGEPGAA